jgi:hypothetical protein
MGSSPLLREWEVKEVPRPRKPARVSRKNIKQRKLRRFARGVEWREKELKKQDSPSEE